MEDLVDQGGFSVVYVRDDRDIAYLVHNRARRYGFARFKQWGDVKLLRIATYDAYKS